MIDGFDVCVARKLGEGNKSEFERLLRRGRKQITPLFSVILFAIRLMFLAHNTTLQEEM